METKTILRWLSDNPKLLDTTISENKLKLNYKTLQILNSKLKANHFDYYKKKMGLQIKIEIKGYEKKVKAIIPYESNPVEFYKWWKTNQNQIHLSFKNKLNLINKIYTENKNILTSNDKKLLEKN